MSWLNLSDDDEWEDPFRRRRKQSTHNQTQPQTGVQSNNNHVSNADGKFLNVSSHSNDNSNNNSNNSSNNDSSTNKNRNKKIIKNNRINKNNYYQGYNGHGSRNRNNNNNNQNKNKNKNNVCK